MSGKCMIYNEEKFVKIEKKSKTFTVDDYLANLTQVLVKSKNKPMGIEHWLVFVYNS